MCVKMEEVRNVVANLLDANILTPISRSVWEPMGRLGNMTAIRRAAVTAAALLFTVRLDWISC